MPSDMEFVVTDEHIKLLRRAYINWEDCEFGAPAIDCKRPYGNSNVLGDIAEILGYDADYSSWDEPPRELIDMLHRLHRETQIALQIFLSTGRMVTGRYTSTNYGGSWNLVAEYVNA